MASMAGMASSSTAALLALPAALSTSTGCARRSIRSRSRNAPSPPTTSTITVCSSSSSSSSSSAAGRRQALALFAGAGVAAATWGSHATVALADAMPVVGLQDLTEEAVEEAGGGGGSAGPTKVFVAGARGNLGARVVRQLLARGVSVRAGVRDIARAKETLGEDPKLEYVVADVTEMEALAKAVAGVDAIVVATGASGGNVFQQAYNVDWMGTKNLVDAAKASGVPRLVLCTSLLTNGAAVGQVLNPSFIILNLFGGILFWKRKAEEYLLSSGLDYTIVRPGGLKNDPPAGGIVATSADKTFGGSIPRDQVAQVMVEALFTPEASRKIIEIVATNEAPKRQVAELFQAV
eukprot:jgi/Chlat1/2827/Chrsp187S02926